MIPILTDTFGAQSTQDLYGSLSGSRCVILATAHSDYLKFATEMFQKDSIIVDTIRGTKRSRVYES